MRIFVNNFWPSCRLFSPSSFRPPAFAEDKLRPESISTSAQASEWMPTFVGMTGAFGHKAFLCFLLGMNFFISLCAGSAFANEVVAKREMLLCEEIKIFEKHNQYLADGLYAQAADYPLPPICVDVYEGQKLDGQYEKRMVHTEGKIEDIDLPYLKVKIGKKEYWGMASSIRER